MSPENAIHPDSVGPVICFLILKLKSFLKKIKLFVFLLRIYRMQKLLDSMRSRSQNLDVLTPEILIFDAYGSLEWIQADVSGLGTLFQIDIQVEKDSASLAI